jgi:hypothetical protein
MGLVFEIGHEVDLSEYTSTVTDSGDLSWSRLAALSGTVGGMQALIDDTTAIYGEKTYTALTGTNYRFRLYIDPNGLTMAANDRFEVAQILNSGLGRASVTLGYDGSSYEVRAAVLDDSSSWQETSLYDITDDQHRIEVLVSYASSDVASDATLDLWVDGASQEQVAGIDLYDLSKPNQARLGAASGLDAGTNGTLYLDEFVLRDDNVEIGDALPVAPTIRGGFTCTVGTNAGTKLAEIEPNLRSVTWRLNKAGQVAFSISQDATKATETNLRFRNRLLIEFENGLPNWGGVIDDPEDWSGSGDIECTAYGPGSILAGRRTGKDVQFEGMTAGQMLSQLIGEANGVRDTGIVLGTVWSGGDTHTEAYHKAEILGLLREEFCERLADADFYFTSTLSGGQITFTLNYVQQRGERKPGVALIEDHNVSSVRLTRQRAIGYAEDTDSIAKYGLYEGVESYSDITSETALDAIAANKLAGTKDPRTRVSLDAEDKAPATFASYRVGDTVRCVLYDKDYGGYDHMVRVMAVQYRPNGNVCGLVVEEND